MVTIAFRITTALYPYGDVTTVTDLSNPIPSHTAGNSIKNLCVSKHMFTRAKALLPVLGITVALILRIVASQERQTGLQDSPPSIAPAMAFCESLNAPATLLLGALLLLIHTVHVYEILSSRAILEMLFHGGVALLWFVVGLEVDLRTTRSVSARHRGFAASIAVVVIVALVWLGVAAYRQEQVALTMGCAAWSAALALFSCTDMIRLWCIHNW